MKTIHIDTLALPLVCQMEFLFQALIDPGYLFEKMTEMSLVGGVV